MAEASKLQDLFNLIIEGYNQIKQNSKLATNFKPSFSNRHSKILPSKPEEQINSVLKLTDQLQSLFLLLIPSHNSKFKSYRSNDTNTLKDFSEKNNDILVEIILHVGSFITNNTKAELFTNILRIDDKFELYLKYSQLITNLAEKSPIRTDSLGSALNKLVEYLIDAAFFLASNPSINEIDGKKLAYEIYHALGSLIYRNGARLNMHNLNRLFGDNDSMISNKKTRQDMNQKDGLLFLIRQQIEENIETSMNMNSRDDIDTELNNKLNLITTQLIFNLTMSIEMNTETFNYDINHVESKVYLKKFIDDKYKIKAVYLLMKILRYHDHSCILQTKNSFVSETNRHFLNKEANKLNDDRNSNVSKIFCKSLQGLENLITSIAPSTNYQNQNSNWLQSHTTYFQLGDILAITKVLCTYGLSLRIPPKSLIMQNNVDDLRLEMNKTLPMSESSLINSSKNELKVETEKSIDLGTGDKEKNVSNISNELSWRKNPNEDFINSNDNNMKTKQNNYSGGFHQKSKRYTKTRHSKNNPFSGIQKQSCNSKLSTNNDTNKDSHGTSQTNSIQCLSEVQVPLIHYQKNDDDGLNQSNSDVSDTNCSSKLQLEKSYAKVRIAAFGVLLTSFQTLDKRTLLSYWDSFLSSNKSSNSKSSSNNYNLLWSIRNDSSPKVRLIASNTLALYLEHAKTFFNLTAAEELSHQSYSSLFIPISLNIAILIRELHKNLLVSLCTLEAFTLNQIQLLKCLQCLMKATPYQKLRPGLIYKLIINLNCFLNQKIPDSMNWMSKINQNSTNLICEVLQTILLLLTNYHDIAEVHLALVSPIFKEKSIQIETDEVDKLTSKLENLSNIFKVPNISQSRVTYFYTSDVENLNNKTTSSISDSMTTSGQITPLLNDLLDGSGLSKCKEKSGKSWIVNCTIKICNLKNNDLMVDNSNLNKVRTVCLEVLQVICKKYFDLLRRDLFFDDLCETILNIIEFVPNTSVSSDYGEQSLQHKALKLLEEFARCLATSELRARNNIDLSDCCKFWLSLLNSKLVSQILCNEQYYLLSSAACDCLASIGASIFELLPFQKRIYCLTNLLHLTKSKSNLIRSSSVRALGVYVTFTSLKEDQTFLNDLSHSLQTLLDEDTNNLVRQKTAWSMSNLSEVLVENSDKVGKAFTNEFNLTIWLRLLDTASHACLRESDKLKSYLVRSLGNLISYITVFDVEYLSRELNLEQLNRSVTKGIEALCQCRNVKMLKVKWNLSHAIGVSMRNFSSWKLQLLNPHWLQMFYGTLLALFTESSNYKVRINACIALMTVNIYNRDSIGLELNKSNKKLQSKGEMANENKELIYIKLWESLIEAFSKLYHGEQNIDETNETQHKSTLVHQLCKFFTYLCKYLRLEDMDNLLNRCFNKMKSNNNLDKSKPIIRSHELKKELLAYLKEIFEHIGINKQEVQFYNEALTQLNLLSSQKETNSNEDCINFLQGLLQKSSAVEDIKNNRDESESSNITLENDMADIDPNDFNYSDFVPKRNGETNINNKFPFKKTYD